MSPPVRPAATVMLVRDGEPGLEVLMVRRAPNAVFASGMYVFPGGRVDEADGDARGDDAYAVAAIRECFEEAGVLLARDAAGDAVRADHAVFAGRAAVHAGERSFTDLLEQHGMVADTDALVFVDWWVTPKGETPRRFDTRFFVAAAPPDQLGAHDARETVDCVWVQPSEALARHTMMPPTIAQLRFLAQFPGVADVFTAARAMPRPQRREPRLIPGTFNVLLPGDAGYDDLD